MKKCQQTLHAFLSKDFPRWHVRREGWSLLETGIEQENAYPLHDLLRHPVVRMELRKQLGARYESCGRGPEEV